MPDGWKRCRIDELAEVRSGRQRSHRITAGTLRPYLRVANVFDGFIKYDDVLEMPFTDREFEELSLRPGDVLMNEGQSLKLVGRSALFDGPPGKYAFQNTLIRVRALDGNMPEFIVQLFRHLQRTGRFAEIASRTTSIAHLGAERLAALRILIPSPSAQADIVHVLQLADTALRSIRDAIRACNTRLRGLMQQLFTGQRRLRGFARQSWESVLIGEVVQECSQRNRGQFGIDRVMAVNKIHGLIPMRERTIAADIDRYKVVAPGAFAYNPMRINIGSIARSHLDGPLLVSPDYVVFECNKCDPRYFDFLRQSEVWRRHMLIAGNGSVRVRIYFDDLARLRFRMPGPKEQRAIADVLETAQREIDLLKQLREQIQRQKRGLMQKLLTGQIPVPKEAHA